VTDHPLLFSAPMVRAKQADLKTQTRRLLSPASTLFNGRSWSKTQKAQVWNWPEAWVDDGPSPAGNPGPYLKLPWISGDPDPYQGTVHRIYPKIQPGDRIWVKETFARVGDNDDDIHACPDLTRHVYYYADSVQPEVLRWRPSIFMPRQFSRTTLIVTEVRIERLQEISRTDAIAEGASPRPRCNGFNAACDGWSMDWSQVGQFSKYSTGGPGPLQERDISLGDPVSAFGSFINELHGGPRWNMKPNSLWEQNPWVIAYTFRVEKRNIDEVRS